MENMKGTLEYFRKTLRPIAQSVLVSRENLAGSPFDKAEQAERMLDRLDAGDVPGVRGLLHKIGNDRAKEILEESKKIGSAPVESAPVSDSTIIVEDSFRDLIPAMSKDEFELLEASILKEGCRDPLIIWSGENVLLDGHNRFTICKKHKLPYTIKHMQFDDEDNAKAWMLMNQIGRRNLSPDALSKLRGDLYNLTKRQDGGHGDQKSGCHFDTPINAAEQVAKQTGVSEATIKRDGKYAEAVEKVKAVAPEITKQIAEGTAPAKKDIIEAGKIVEENPEQAKGILSGSVKAAIKAIKPDATTGTGKAPVETAGNATTGDYISLHVEVIKFMMRYFPEMFDKGLGEVLKQYNPEQKITILAMPRN